MPYAHVFWEISHYTNVVITQGGYTILFLMTLLEGVPLFGLAVPGHVAIILGGFLARIGTLNLWWVFIISTAGAVLGDYMSFLIGRKYGLAFITRFRRYSYVADSSISRAQKLIDSHAGKALLLGRFSPVTRGFMPFLVGVSSIHVKKFWIYNILGAIIWVGASVGIGYVFGAGYHAAAGYFGKFVIVAAVGAVLIIWGYRFVNMRFHVFKRYELFALIFNLLSLWVLAEMVQDAWASRSFMSNFDVWVNGFIAAHAHHSLTIIAALISSVASPTLVTCAGILMSIYFLLRKKWRSAAIMILSLVSVNVLVGLMKEFFLRARPENALQVLLDNPSFPSGHAAVATAFFVIFAYLLAQKISSWVKRELLIDACILAMIAVGLSRIILNVHWASDVIAGWALGVFVATGSILFVRYASALLFNRGIISVKEEKVVAVPVQAVIK